MSGRVEVDIRVAVSCNRRFLSSPDGRVWTRSIDDYEFWIRYLTAFERVQIISRVERVDEAPRNWKLVNGPRVSVLAIPYYEGPMGYIRSRWSVLGQLRRSLDTCDAVILRIPGHVGTSVERILRSRGQPFGVEIIGDIGAAYSPGSISHILRPLVRTLGVRAVRRQCWNACATAYVTAGTLQSSYPPNPDSFSTHYSSIQLTEAEVCSAARVFDRGRCKVVTVGSMEQRYKRFDVLIEAVRRCVATGLDLGLVLIGDGRNRSFFEQKAKALGGRVQFVGELSGPEAVRRWLQKADLFVLPSANEGLPRVVIEAMAAGLPCLGTDVGGMSELLPEEYLVPIGDVDRLEAKIAQVVSSPDRMNAMSARNLEVACQYTDTVLQNRRNQMYENVRDATREYVGRISTD